MDISEETAKKVKNGTLDEKMEFAVLTTLGLLKGFFADEKLDDRKASLALHYFIKRFVQHGWKGNKPSIVLEESIKIIKETKGDDIVNL